MFGLKFNKKTIITLIVILLALFIIVAPLTARAGGGGGSSRSSGGGFSGSGGSSGGGDGIIMLVYFIIYSIPFPFNLIVIAVLLFFVFKAGKKGRQSSGVNRIPEPGQTMKPHRGYQDFLNRTPDFDEPAFMAKVHSAFMTIQEGWTKKDMSKARRFISDGVYQRFAAQFKMMDILKQTNKLDNIVVSNIAIDDVQTDGVYDIITVAVHASLKDTFESELYKKLNSGGREEFVEYWSFLRKRSLKAPQKDIYTTEKCPACGGELGEEMGEVARCPFCNRLSNTGDYDWVLSEITQADDRVAEQHKRAKLEKLSKKVQGLVEENEDFSVQLIEDRASNAFLRILQARVEGNPDKIKRFVSDNLYTHLNEHKNDGIVYNRLYLNNMFLTAVGRRGDKDILALSAKYTYQRVKPDGSKVKILDPAMNSSTEILIMERDSAVYHPAGSVYSYSCPSCGGELKDSTDTSCQYCGEPLNSTKFDWVITTLLSPAQWRNYHMEHKADFSYSAEPDLINSLYKVRDYAFNNVLVMIAIDGDFDEREQEYADKLAKRWGYDKRKIQGMVNMASTGRLSLRWPEQKKDQQKIYRLMKKAAEADATVTPQEKELLEHVERMLAG